MSAKIDLVKSKSNTSSSSSSSSSRWSPIIWTFLILPLCLAAQKYEENTTDKGSKLVEQNINLRPRTTILKVTPQLQLARQERDTLKMIHMLMVSSKCHFKLRESAEASILANEAEQLARLLDSIPSKMNLFSHLAAIHQNNGDFDRAISYLDPLLREAQRESNDLVEANILLKIGSVRGDQGDFVQYIQCIDEAKKIYESKRVAEGLNGLHRYMADYYNLSGERAKAVDENIQLLNRALKAKDTTQIIESYGALLNNYIAIDSLNMAESYYQKLVHYASFSEVDYVSQAELSYGVLHVRQGQHSRALALFEKCQPLLDERDIANLVTLHHWKAIAYRGLDRYDLAAKESEIAYNLSIRHGFLRGAEKSAYALFQTNYWRDHHKEALEWILEADKQRDSIFDLERIEEMRELEAQYETFRKEQEIEILRANEETNRNKRSMLAIGLILSLLSGSLVIYNQILKRKKDREIFLQEQELSQEKQKNLKLEVDFRQQELSGRVKQLASKNEFLQELENEVQSLSNHADRSMSKTTDRIKKMISFDQLDREDWKQFVQEFKVAHPEFTEKLRHVYGSFTHSEMRLITLLRMNLSSKEIANILRITDQGVWKSRYRIRKKMGLKGEVDLQELILAI